MVSADLLVLLSDIDGLYDGDPKTNNNVKLIPAVTEITQEIQDMAGKAASNDSSGGMVTKLAAAKQCIGSGCSMVITKGDHFKPLQALENGAKCTWFQSANNPQSARKNWISGTLQPCGTFTIDNGALIALKTGRSLLPAGVIGVKGSFQRGDTIVIETVEGTEVGRGLSAYSSDDALLIKGHNTDDILALLGYRGRDEIIHRDDLVLI
jgi:glutamate 5-kinase